MKRRAKPIHRKVRKPTAPPAKAMPSKKKYSRKREKLRELEIAEGC